MLGLSDDEGQLFLYQGSVTLGVRLTGGTVMSASIAMFGSSKVNACRKTEGSSLMLQKIWYNVQIC